MPLRPPLIDSVLQVSNASIVEFIGCPLDARRRGAFCSAARDGTQPSHVTVTRHATSIHSVRISIISRCTDTLPVEPRRGAPPDESASLAQIPDVPQCGHQSAAAIPAAPQRTCTAVTRQMPPAPGSVNPPP
eukprot:7391928-Prymnesium_polylepis.1